MYTYRIEENCRVPVWARVQRTQAGERLIRLPVLPAYHNQYLYPYILQVCANRHAKKTAKITAKKIRENTVKSFEKSAKRESVTRFSTSAPLTGEGYTGEWI